MMQKLHKKKSNVKTKKLEFDFILLDKKKNVLETWEWTYKPVVELILSRKKAEQIKYWQVRDAKTNKKIITQKCKLTKVETPDTAIEDSKLCSISIDLSKCFNMANQLFKIKK